MQHPGRARLNADIDELLYSRRGPDVSEDSVDAALAASAALLSIATRSMEDALDVLTLSEYTTMEALASDSLSLQELAEHPDAVPATITGLIDSGWISEASGGERYRLTPHGEQLIAAIAATRRARLMSVLDALSADERQDIARAFTAFAAAAGAGGGRS